MSDNFKIIVTWCYFFIIFIFFHHTINEKIINNLSNASNVDALNTNNISKSLIILLSIISCTNAMQLTDVLKPHDINHVKLLHNKNDFFIDNSEVVRKIERCDIDKEIRGIDTAKLAKMMAAGHYLTVNKYQNTDEYNVRLKGRLNGGGPLGFNIGWYTGKIFVERAGHGALYAISLLSGPGQPVAHAILETKYALVIENASNLAGLGLGILVGGSSGPV